MSFSRTRNEVILLPIPFTDLTSRKVRPAVVIGHSKPVLGTGRERQVRVGRVQKEAPREQELPAEKSVQLPANGPKKADLARCWQAATTMMASWIAEKLGITSVSYLHQLW